MEFKKHFVQIILERIHFIFIIITIFTIVTVFFFLYINKEEWIYIKSYENAVYYFDKNSVIILDDSNTIEVIRKCVHLNSDEYPKPWDYSITRLVIKCNTGEMKTIESIVYYKDGTNSNWHISPYGFINPKGDFLAEERDIICSKK